MVTCCGSWSPAAEGGQEERAGGERGEETEGRDRAWLGSGLGLGPGLGLGSGSGLGLGLG